MWWNSPMGTTSDPSSTIIDLAIQALQARKFKCRVVDGGSFTEAETTMILNAVPKEKLPPATIAKLESISVLGYIDIIGRNLKVLLDKEIAGDST